MCPNPRLYPRSPPPLFVNCQALNAPCSARVDSQMRTRQGGGGGGGARFRSVFRLRNGALGRVFLPSPSPLPAEDGPLRCKQMTLLLDWVEHFEAESRQSDEAVAFSMLLGDLNFDNCSLGEKRLQRGGAGQPGPAHQALPSLCRPSAGAGAPALQSLLRPLPPGHTPGAALGSG